MWILLLIINGSLNGHPTLATTAVEFSSQANCDGAKKSILMSQHSTHVDTVDATCLKK